MLRALAILVYLRGLETAIKEVAEYVGFGTKRGEMCSLSIPSIAHAVLAAGMGQLPPACELFYLLVADYKIVGWLWMLLDVRHSHHHLYRLARSVIRDTALEARKLKARWGGHGHTGRSLS